jgi:succinate dehydrogenase flavin-adding protein (antitoxin of CptAB toxin-antitoxin module)
VKTTKRTWEANKFLGRPEPIYTYSSTERTGQLSFKIVVDHPSILNLMVREEFKNMSDEEADNYINALFAGCENYDFYDLIKRYTTLDKSDVEYILAYLNKGGSPEQIKQYNVVTEEVEKPKSNVITPSEPKTTESEVYKQYH